MRDIKFSILLGIGIGLVLSSGFHMVSSNNTIKITPEIIKAEAKKLGMIEPSEHIDKKQIENKSSKLNDEGKILIEIPQGANDEKIADILKENNLIESREIFIESINKKNNNKVFKSGKIEILDTDCIDDIIEKIIDQ